MTADSPIYRFTNTIKIRYSLYLRYLPYLRYQTILRKGFKWLVLPNKRKTFMRLSNLRRMSTLPTTKQNVFVPEYPGKPVYEAYHGVPASEYLERSKQALDKFIRECDKCTYSLEGWQTHNGKFNRRTAHLVTDVKTSITENGKLEVFAGGTTFQVNPPKYGTDQVSNNDRFWLFDSASLNDINLVRENAI